MALFVDIQNKLKEAGKIFRPAQTTADIQESRKQSLMPEALKSIKIDQATKAGFFPIFTDPKTYVEDKDKYIAPPAAGVKSIISKIPVKQTIAALVGALTTTSAVASTPNEYSVSPPEQPSAPALKTYVVKDRGVEIPEDKLKEIGAVIYGEASTSPDQMRKIANVILNRAAKNGMTVEEVLTMPTKNGGYQFNAYGGKQFSDYMQGNLDFLSKKKAAMVDAVLEEIKNGTIVDDTGGAEFFKHDKKGNLVIDNTRPLFK